MMAGNSPGDTSGTTLSLFEARPAGFLRTIEVTAVRVDPECSSRWVTRARLFPKDSYCATVMCVDAVGKFEDSPTEPPRGESVRKTGMKR